VATNRLRTAGAVPRARAARGFTLLEVMVAVAIMGMALSILAQVQYASVQNGTEALNLRDVRVAGDTIFRRLVYEIELHPDGESNTLDVWYSGYIGLHGAARDRWAIYRGVFHKKRGVAAGTDPTGRSEPLFADSGTGTTTGSTTPRSTRTTTGATGTAAETTAEEVYVLSLEIYLTSDADTGEATPKLTLRTIVPVPASELEQTR
jgi:prepilin-type N-terminal cleavage/methylation domain-containing protein